MYMHTSYVLSQSTVLTNQNDMYIPPSPPSLYVVLDNLSKIYHYYIQL